MTESLEIEFKTLLTKKEFEELLTFFNLTKKDAYWQKNTYFDTENFVLRNKKMSLRIREFEDSGEQTLKVPTEHGKTEITDSLEKAILPNLYEKGTIAVPSAIATKLVALNISPNDLKKIGTLKTFRYDVSLPIGLLSLDHSFYYGKEDFELELEVTNYQKGKQDFDEFLYTHHVKYRKTPSKIARMFKENALK